MYKKRLILTAILAASLVLSGLLLAACSITYEKPIVIWTNQVEFATYVELFNASQDKVKATVVYKKSPAEALPPAADEQAPDIVIGPWLKNERIRRYFTPVDYLFTDQHINPSIFYPQLLALGNVSDKQYLLPVSFNLPTIIFSDDYQEQIPDDYLINADTIRDIGKSFNLKNKSGIFTSMGFAPRWDSDFLYHIAKMKGGNFAESDDVFSWDKSAMDKTVAYLRQWTTDINQSSSAEEDFKFKYLYTPEEKWISSKKCLFSYTTSNELFVIAPEMLQGIDFRWLHEDLRIPIEDNTISMGIYKKSKNIPAAELFLIWFLNEANQKELLEWVNQLNLYSKTFGISGGFSSIRGVNERVFPLFYPLLMGNLPVAEYLTTPNILPTKWESIKERIIFPYLLEATNTNTETMNTSLELLIKEWRKQFF